MEFPSDEERIVNLIVDYDDEHEQETYKVFNNKFDKKEVCVNDLINGLL